MSNPRWLDKGSGATSKFRGVAMSPHGSATVDDALATILEHRDAELQPTIVPNATRFAKPADRAGMEHIVLEPIAPSIGTVIHGVDCADLSDAEVAYIREVWLARKVVFFRDQGCDFVRSCPHLPSTFAHFCFEKRQPPHG